MADSASTELKIRLMEDGVTSSWGDKVDTNMQIIEHALTGSATASLAGSDWTLSDADYTEDEGKASILIATGSLGANRNIVIPNKKKYWIVKNDTTGSYTVTVKTSGGTGKTVTQSTVATFWCDGADAVYHVVPMVNATTGAPATSSGAAASSVSFTATGSISSTNVQAAIAEVDGDVTALSAAVAAGYQPLDSDLTAIAGLSAADGNFIVGDGVTWTVESGATARASLGVATASDAAEGLIEIATTAETQTGTDTSRATTPAGVLAVFDGLVELPIKAMGMVQRQTNGAAPYVAEKATNDAMVAGYAFDASTDEYIETWLIMPETYDGGTIYAKIAWTTAATAGTGDVVWGVQANFLRNDDAIDAAAGTAQTVTDGFLADGDMHLTAWTSAITPSGTYTRAAGARTVLRIVVYRDANNASDTYTQDAVLTDIIIAFPVDKSPFKVALT